MRILLISLFLCSCASLAPSTKPGDITLSPVLVKNAPKAFELHREQYAFNWGDRKIRGYLAPVKLKNSDPETQRMYGFGPVIEVKTKKETRLLDLRERFPSHCISAVFHDQWNTRIWVLMQECIEGPASAYTAWISENGGESWFRGADIERPAPRFPPSDLFTLFVDKNGKGEAWFKLDASHGSSDANIGADLSEGQELIYKSSTVDGGRSWIVDKEPVLKNGMLEVGRAE